MQATTAEFIGTPAVNIEATSVRETSFQLQYSQSQAGSGYFLIGLPVDDNAYKDSLKPGEFGFFDLANKTRLRRLLAASDIDSSILRTQYHGELDDSFVSSIATVNTLQAFGSSTHISSAAIDDVIPTHQRNIAIVPCNSNCKDTRKMYTSDTYQILDKNRLSISPPDSSSSRRLTASQQAGGTLIRACEVCASMAMCNRKGDNLWSVGTVLAQMRQVLTTDCISAARPSYKYTMQQPYQAGRTPVSNSSNLQVRLLARILLC